MRYIPAIVCLAVAGLFALATLGGDNIDNRAMAQIFWFPAALFFILAVIAAAIACLTGGGAR